MPLSLPFLMPTVLAKVSVYSRTSLQHLWNGSTSAKDYQDVVRSARSSASHHIMLCATNLYIKRLDKHEKIDRLEDLAMGLDEDEAGAELMLNTIEDLDASERTWKSISEILKYIEDYLGNIISAKDDVGVKYHSESAERRLDMLAAMIVEAAKQAGRIALRDPILSSSRAKL
jgi:hypothetical protein